MRLCRFDDDRIGVVTGEEVADVTAIVAELPAVRYPLPLGDPLIANLKRLRPAIEALAATAPRRKLKDVRLLSPVANPTKIIGAPSNYLLHVDEAQADKEISAGRPRRTIGEAGLFLKSSSSLVGVGEGVAVRLPDRRTDHEVELAAVIGEYCEHITEDRALDIVAGYAIGLDMVVRGPEDRSLRKSIDSYSVLGPWLVTGDEIADPDALDLSISVNGEQKQKSNTREMIYSVRKQIAWATEFYALHPGDIIMTGTPEGVGPVRPGDVMVAEIEGIGRAEIKVRAYKAAV